MQRAPIPPAGERRPFIVPVFLPHAGCPHRCIFCNQEAITAGAGPVLAAAAVREGIEAHLRHRSNRRGGAEIAFYGGNFLGLEPDRTRELLDIGREFVESGRVDGLRFSTRPDTVDARRLALLAGYPVTTVEIGAQSMDDGVLAAAGRGHTAADTRRAVALLKSTPIRIGLQLMVGLPGEEEGGCLESARRAAALAPDFVRIYPTVVLAGSALADRLRQGTYRPLSLEEAVARTAVAFRVFSDRRIPVVRMGLQADPALEAAGRLLAGPHHPAFGHLVYSALFLEAAALAVASDGGGWERGRLRLSVNPHRIPQMRGLHNANVRELGRRFGFAEVHVAADDAMPPNMLRVGKRPPVTVYGPGGATDG